jgi:hypothetical protein
LVREIKLCLNNVSRKGRNKIMWILQIHMNIIIFFVVFSSCFVVIFNKSKIIKSIEQTLQYLVIHIPIFTNDKILEVCSIDRIILLSLWLPQTCCKIDKENNYLRINMSVHVLIHTSNCSNIPIGDKVVLVQSNICSQHTFILP